MLTERRTFHECYTTQSVQTFEHKRLPPIQLRPGEERPIDEFANFVTHGIGFLLSVAGAVFMTSIAIALPDPLLSASAVVYCATLVSLYAASTLSHAFHDYRRRRYYRTLDQACIFLLIAGSYTPFAAAFLTDGWWPLLTIAMWGLALTGAYLVFRWGYLSAMAQRLYVVLGWLPAIGLPTIIASASPMAVTWIVVGGVLYTLGTLFLWQDHKVRYFHAVWHSFVIAASICHFAAILSLLTLQ
jgi:hemolysin III